MNLKDKIIYRVLNEDDSCREYYFNCIGDTLKGFKEYYSENVKMLESKSLEYLIENYGHYLYREELKCL